MKTGFPNVALAQEMERLVNGESYKKWQREYLR